MERHKKWYIAAVIWAIIGAIGFILLFLASSPPQLLSFAEILGIVGVLGSWLCLVTGATVWGQDEMLKGQDASSRLLEEIRDALKAR